MQQIEGLRAEQLGVENKHALVRKLVAMIPAGHVASYGMIASLCAGVTPRLVGFVMAGLDAGSEIPWHRVIQSAGTIAARPGSDIQRDRLANEGILFTKAGKVNWKLYAWPGPSLQWFYEKGVEIEDALTLTHGWPVRDGET